MSRIAGPEISVGRMEKPAEGHQEAQIASNFFQDEAQLLRLDAPLSMAPDNQNQNSDVQAMLGGFGIVNALAKNDNLLANPDVPQQPNLQFAQNDGPLSGANAIGVLQNVLQGLDNVGADAVNSDTPPPQLDTNGNSGGNDQPQPPATPSDSPSKNNGGGNTGDQPQPPSMGLPQWMLNFLN